MYRDVVEEFIQDTELITVSLESGSIDDEEWDEMVEELDERIKDLESLKDKLDMMDDKERIEWLKEHGKAYYETV